MLQSKIFLLNSKLNNNALTLTFLYYINLINFDQPIQFIHLECVYGSNLISLCQRENRSYPLFVEVIIEEIEAKGLDIDGIYRISGNLAEVQKVRHQVDHGKYSLSNQL